jgi:hypothetical protein
MATRRTTKPKVKPKARPQPKAQEKPVVPEPESKPESKPEPGPEPEEFQIEGMDMMRLMLAKEREKSAQLQLDMEKERAEVVFRGIQQKYSDGGKYEVTSTFNPEKQLGFRVLKKA